MRYTLQPELGARILAARKAAGLSRWSLSLKSGIRPETIYKYETGQHEPYAGSLAALATALEVSLDWLAYGDGRAA